MGLDTVIHAGLRRSSQPHRTALVLMGGGARCAYQAGVLQALARRLRQAGCPSHPFVFPLLVGTSAGALNAACLASFATEGLQAFDRLAGLWRELRSEQVYRLHVPPWATMSRFLAAVELWRNVRRHGAVLDNGPLVDELPRRIPLAGLEAALAGGAIDALAVTASSYSSGAHWTFCQTRSDRVPQSWVRPGRRVLFERLTHEHLLASSAIPFIFPDTPLTVDGRQEFFGDGSMRQISPLSPALHLGATRLLVVGVGQPERAALGAESPRDRAPGMGGIAGHAMASVFHDTLQADVEQAQRVTRSLRHLPPEVAAHMPYRAVEVLALQPSQSLDALALAHLGELPRPVRRALQGLGALRAGGAALASYLLFEPGFVSAVMALFGSG